MAVWQQDTMSCHLAKMVLHHFFFRWTSPLKSGVAEIFCSSILGDDKLLSCTKVSLAVLSTSFDFATGLTVLCILINEMFETINILRVVVDISPLLPRMKYPRTRFIPNSSSPICNW